MSLKCNGCAPTAQGAQKKRRRDFCLRRALAQRVNQLLRSDLVARTRADMAEEDLPARREHHRAALLPWVALGPSLVKATLPGLEIREPPARPERQQRPPLEPGRRVALQRR